MMLLAAFMTAVSMPAFSQKQEAFGQAKLEAFATAAIKIERLVAERQPQIDKAETLEQANAIADAAVDEIAAIIVDTPGITLPEYRVISRAVENDPELHERVNMIAKRLQEGTSRSFDTPPST
jgi:Cu2+-containing amine oxidase